MKKSVLLKAPMVTNVHGVRYLSKGSKPGVFAVKMEIGCFDGEHGVTKYLYIGRNYNLAVKIANHVNFKLQSGMSRESVFRNTKEEFG